MTDYLTLLKECSVCPRNCKINRLKNELGFCGIGKNPKISSYNLHFGEELPISGVNGSGTIFFTGCNLKCVFCQNYPISQLNNGNEVTIEKLADLMLSLQNQKAHNINLVTPSHVVPQIIEAVLIAKQKGLKIPIVYNTSGYDSVKTLKLLEGIVDIYMPDAKYSDKEMAKKYSNVPDYWEINKLALKEMYRQVGNLEIKNKIAVRGLLIRHLVLPDDISGSKKVFEFIAKEISPQAYISVMAQYHPANRTKEYAELERKITQKEYSNVLGIVDKLNLTNGWCQEL
ncbi:MAG: radical SAM protein [Elusimicrobia bacterium RIFOXYD2_FULL_34_15]|nr:MAG: radical SAM protein [Elusimicrobia bacterium RIFOXYD2_FULL_34_15]